MVKRRVDCLLPRSDVVGERHTFGGGSGLIGPERLGLHSIFTCSGACAAHQDFDARLGLFKLFAASIAQLHAALEQFEGPLERQLAALHFFDNAFELLETDLETQGRVF
jgi:hypothetical protein